MKSIEKFLCRSSMHKASYSIGTLVLFGVMITNLTSHAYEDCSPHITIQGDRVVTSEIIPAPSLDSLKDTAFRGGFNSVILEVTAEVFPDNAPTYWINLTRANTEQGPIIIPKGTTGKIKMWYTVRSGEYFPSHTWDFVLKFPLTDYKPKCVTSWFSFTWDYKSASDGAILISKPIHDEHLDDTLISYILNFDNADISFSKNGNKKIAMEFIMKYFQNFKVEFNLKGVTISSNQDIGERKTFVLKINTISIVEYTEKCKQVAAVEKEKAANLRLRFQKNNLTSNIIN